LSSRKCTFWAPMQIFVVTHATLYRKAVFASFVLSLKPNNDCLQVCGDIAIAKNFFSSSFVVYSKFNIRDNFFSYPVNSSLLGIFKVSELSETLVRYRYFQCDSEICEACT
jgi:hypothetical protein